MGKLILSLAAVMMTSAGHAALSCRVLYPPNTPVPKTYNVCLTNGESDRLHFETKPDVDSIRVIRADDKCLELESNVGAFMFDTRDSSLLMGPKLPTGCYLVLWNEA